MVVDLLFPVKQGCASAYTEIKYNIIKSFLQILFVLSSCHIFSQDLYTSIDTVRIAASRLSGFENEIQVKRIRTGETITDALEGTSVQLQANGPGALLTALIHGMGARHTAIIWHGINLQSPVNGTIDLNLVQNFDNVSVIPVSISPGNGTAASSGAIVLGDHTEAGQFMMEYNAMNNFHFRLAKALQLGHYDLRVKWMTIDQQNKYDYILNGDKVQQENAAFKGNDLNLELGNHTGPWRWSTAFWYQQYDREILAAGTAIYNGAKQIDENIRTSFGLHYTDFWQLNAGWLQEEIGYMDAATFSLSENNAYILSSTLRPGSIFNLHARYRYDRTSASFFNGKVDRSNLAVGVQKKWRIASDFQIVTFLRREWIGTYLSPWLYDLSLKYHFSPKWSMLVSTDRSYNLPTFNDLYWPTGGNPDLLPETGRGIDLAFQKQDSLWAFRAMLYYKKVENWILWSPGISYWTPSNQRKVRSSGADFMVSYDRFWRDISGSHQINFHFNATTVLEDRNNQAIIGNQLIYVPKLRIHSDHSFQWNKWTISGSTNFYGDRYTTFDNKEKVDAFLVVDFGLKYILNDNTTLFLKVNNIGDANYQQVAFYPMPLRNFSLGIKIN